VTGVFYDVELGLRQLGAQAIGSLVICTVIFGVAFAFFKIQNAIMKGGIRPDAEEEIAGMDLPEMGVLAYPEFTLVAAAVETNGAEPVVVEEETVST
jgi:Amt family ammonium transporter